MYLLLVPLCVLIQLLKLWHQKLGGIHITQIVPRVKMPATTMPQVLQRSLLAGGLVALITMEIGHFSGLLRLENVTE